ncbi:hypothetical protein Val02_77810 [Virgisporangium aliadipatigenens]|uniref:Prepilin-type N-terminal cleavage/methylation domain-containing protein n=1 Tax=Virgisporangium aliadipatigenens TaxID=741659 RepID=A0A8J3YW12_9ACTN|nr:prepilin-type N-terminal cleavage/methylation domain-containing protein [Virgisporangium aliadipatigenens]GIJ50895.1 hypothetical protein Val02_77810 [Virgisporangium aliadipatigenens]
MTLLERFRRRLPVARGDDGFTLAEVLVSMVLMAVVMSVFMTGVLQMFRTANGTINAATAQGEINRMYLRLDRSIRYAASISNTYTALSDGNNIYLQYLVTNADPDVCNQLRLNVTDGVLQYRSWVSGQVISLTTGWQTLASNVVYGPTSPSPFTRSTSGDFQRLRLLIETRVPNTQVTAVTDVTFTAMNSSAKTLSDTVCIQNRPA